MNILAVDTTTKYLCVGVGKNSQVCSCDVEVGARHSLLLALTIKRAVGALGLRLPDIDYLACGLGPGSFTGIRVGLSTIKGLALGLQKPVVGVGTLDIIARNAVVERLRMEDRCASLIIPAIDAKRNLIYCSGYKFAGSALKRAWPYMLLKVDEFLKKIPPGSILLGDALGLYQEPIARFTKGAILLDKDYWYPRAHQIIPLARDRIATGKVDDVFKAKPIYLYPKECQIRNSR